MRLPRTLAVPALLLPLFSCIGAPPVIESYPHHVARTVRVDGVEIHYFDFNHTATGTVLIWVHGQSGASFETSYLAVELTGDHRLIALDLPGNGLSEKPRRRYTDEYYQEVLRQFISYIDVDEYVLVGHSLGGVSVLPVAAEQPPGLQALILVAPYYFRGQAGGLREFLSNTGPLVDLAMALYAPWMMQMIVRREAFYNADLVPENLLAFYRTALFHTENGRGALASVTRHMVGKERETDVLGQVTVPTLIAWGREDRVLSYDHAERFVTAIPGSTLVTYERTGHLPHVERAREFAADLRLFLRGAHPGE